MSTSCPFHLSEDFGLMLPNNFSTKLVENYFISLKLFHSLWLQKNKGPIHIENNAFW